MLNDENLKPLTEGYREAKELDKLATATIEYFAKRNYPLINRLNKKGVEMKNLYFNFDTARLDEIVDPDTFTVIDDFLKVGGVRIMFSLTLGSNGVYHGGYRKLIGIKTQVNDFLNNLQYQLTHVTKDPDDGSISEDECVRVLRSAIGVSFRSTMIHEFQHAYDDYVSKGKYYTDKKSKKYYKSLQYKYDDVNSVMSPKEKIAYLQLPHEYWARFSQAVSHITKREPWNILLTDFHYFFDGFWVLSKNDQRRTVKAFYKYCELNNLIEPK